MGYYKQDFHTLPFDKTPYQLFMDVGGGMEEQVLRSLAAGFLINSDILFTKIGNLSEGQKGLVSLMKLVLQKPGLLILVSHVPEFVQQIRIDEILDLDK